MQSSSDHEQRWDIGIGSIVNKGYWATRRHMAKAKDIIIEPLQGVPSVTREATESVPYRSIYFGN